MLRLVLDNNVVNLLSGQAGLRANDLRPFRRGLKRKARDGDWQFEGSLFLILEMLGIGKAGRYSAAFSLYWDLIEGRVLKPWDVRVREEMHLRRPLHQDEMFLGAQTVMDIYKIARGAKNHGRFTELVRNQRSYTVER